MRLGDKLRRTLDAPSAPLPAKPASPPTVAPHLVLREALKALKPKGRFPETAPSPSFDPPSDRPPSLMETIPGEVSPWGSEGEVWLSTQRLPLTSFWQRWGPDSLEASHYAHLSAYVGDERLQAFDPRQALYLDVESTGLEHGAGTIAFMIGLGYLDHNEVVLTQLILRDFEEERAQLSLFWDILGSFPYLVSFNGKSFDTSLLQSRLHYQRICSTSESSLKLRPHLDLLHLSRNTLRDTLPNVRLQTLEAQLLSRVREGDMPGSLAPACWFHWLRWQDPRPLAAIAEHNRLDVLSMVELAAHLAALSHPAASHPSEIKVWLNVVQTYVRRRSYKQALQLLNQHHPGLSELERLTMYEQEALLAKRTGDLERSLKAYAFALESKACLPSERERLQLASERVRRSYEKARNR